MLAPFLRPLVSHRRPLRSTADDAIHALEPGQDTPSWVREEGLASVTQAVFVDQTPMQGAGADVPFSDLIAQVSRMVGLDHDHERSAQISFQNSFVLSKPWALAFVPPENRRGRDSARLWHG